MQTVVVFAVFGLFCVALGDVVFCVVPIGCFVVAGVRWMPEGVEFAVVLEIDRSAIDGLHY